MTQELLDRIETLVKENSSLHSSLQEVKENFRRHKEESQNFLTQLGGSAFNRASYEETMAQNTRLTEENLRLKDEYVRIDGINTKQADQLREAYGKIDRLLKDVEDLQREMAIKDSTHSSMIEQLNLRIRTLTNENQSTTDVSGDSPSSS